MFWVGFYPVTALVAAVAIFLLAQWLRRPDVPAPDCPGRRAAVAGLLWPVLILGMAQWVLIAAISLGLTGANHSAEADGPHELTSTAVR